MVQNLPDRVWVLKPSKRVGCLSKIVGLLAALIDMRVMATMVIGITTTKKRQERTIPKMSPFESYLH